MCPIVPTLQCGLLRSNFSFAMVFLSQLWARSAIAFAPASFARILLFSYPGLPPWAKLFRAYGAGYCFARVAQPPSAVRTHATYLPAALFPCTRAMISSATDLGASSYLAKCIEYVARPCVVERMCVA